MNFAKRPQPKAKLVNDDRIAKKRQCKKEKKHADYEILYFEQALE